MEEVHDISKLDLIAAIGFDGSVPGGLKVHPDRQHLVYSIGCTVVVEDIGTRKQQFLNGHTNSVVCTAISKSGRLIASGQVTHMGFKADIIVWDYETLSLYARFTLHKVKVQSLAFSPSEKYLVTLGGQDDGSVVVWNLAKKEALCGSPAQTPSSGVTECIAYSNGDDRLFFTAGDNALRVWTVDGENRKLTAVDVFTGQLKRHVKCMVVADDDEFFYCGTTSGDVLCIHSHNKLFQACGPDKDKFALGVQSLAILKTGEFVVGTGDGVVTLLKKVEREENRKKTFKFVKVAGKMTKLDGAVTSIALRGAGHQFYAGTSKSQVYRFSYAEYTHELANTCHYSGINDVTFPWLCENGRYFGTSDLFATCGFQDIRVWHTPTQKELLRITIPNMTCNAIEFSKDGRILLSGWNDSKIRAFYPESGKLMFTIEDAHKQGVTALTCTNDSQRIISGGGEGQVRVWEIREGSTVKGRTFVTSLIEAMKEHKGSVSCIKISKNDKWAVSASSDGTCIIWDLNRYVRSQVMFSNTLFKCLSFNQPDEVQIVTSGTDRKIAYWETFDGSQIRELVGSRSGAVNGMDMTVDGQYFATCGDDKLVKVWKYNEGVVAHVGVGHSSAIQKVRVCPNSRVVVSVSEDGAVLIWRFPFASHD